MSQQNAFSFKNVFEKKKDIWQHLKNAFKSVKNHFIVFFIKTFDMWSVFRVHPTMF